MARGPASVRPLHSMQRKNRFNLRPRVGATFGRPQLAEGSPPYDGAPQIFYSVAERNAHIAPHKCRALAKVPFPCYLANIPKS